MSMRQETAGEAPQNGASRIDQVRRFGPGAVIAIAALLFIVQNQESADFEFLWFSFTTGLWLMLLVSLLAGFAIGLLWVRRRTRRKMRKLRDAE